jgi:hypothetical protein
MVVWDDQANVTGMPFDWWLNINDVQVNGSTVTVYATDVADSTEQVIFDGTDNGGTWSGGVYFVKGNGTKGQLGNFAIPSASFQ